MTTTTIISPEALGYEWEAYCNTDGRRTAIQMGESTDCISLSSERRGTENAAILDTEYDRAKVPPYNGSDPTSPLEVQKPLCFQT